MSKEDVLEKYQDVLHFIEDAIVSYYHKHPELTDHNVDKVYEAVFRVMQNEQRDKKPPRLKLTELEAGLHEGVLKSARWLVGEGTMLDESGEAVEINYMPKDDMIACLKRLRSSIKLWTTDYGRQGYLEFIKKHFPEPDAD